MRKIIGGVVILLMVAGACAPFVNGLVMEKIVTQFQNDLNEMYADAGSGVTVEIVKYDRNFSSSEIEWSIKLGSLATLYGVDEIILIDRAEHGFTGVVTKTSLEENQWFVDLLNNKLEGKNPLNITTTYTLSGKIKSIIDIGAFSFQKENETVDFRPGRVVTEGGEGLTYLFGKATWKGLSVSDKVTMDGFSLMYDLDKISTYIWAGEISYGVGNIKINDLGETFELLNFKGEYSLDFDKKKNILSTGGEVKIDNLVAGNKKVKDAFFRFDANNIDAQGYEEFMELYTQAAYSVVDDMSATQEDPEKMNKVLAEKAATTGLQMIAACEKILKNGLEIKISDLYAQLPIGKITGNMELKLNQDVTFVDLATIARQPNLAFDILSLQSNLSFPAELAGDNTMLITPLYQAMQTGLFVQDGENLVHKAQTNNGKLFLNGKEVFVN